ncbi:uncharacterized protein [Chiloscyllium punctatum]|uniref:uncharacterized protein isoform X2 n=1 Tax=Chiloscyllium punctatum TaxID=137246 RepID=UPI003B63F6FD
MAVSLRMNARWVLPVALLFSGFLLRPLDTEAEKDHTFGAIGSSVLLDPEYGANLSKSEVLWVYVGSNGHSVNILDYVPNHTLAEPYEHFRSRLHFNASNGSLMLKNLKPSDQGVFTISVDGEKKWTTDLKIIEPLSKPLISSNSSFVGVTIELTCQVPKGKASSIGWLLDDLSITSGQRFLLLQNNSKLIISAAKKSDCGIYTCVVENPVSKQHTTYLLSVYGLSLWHYCTLGFSIATLITLVAVSSLMKTISCLKEVKKIRQGVDERTGINVDVKLTEGVPTVLWFLLKLPFVLLITAFVFWILNEGAAVVTVLTTVFLGLFLIPNKTLTRICWKDSAVWSLVLSTIDLYSEVLALCMSGILIFGTLSQSGNGCEPAPNLQTSLILAMVVPLVVLLIPFCSVFHGTPSRGSCHQTIHYSDVGQHRRFFSNDGSKSCNSLPESIENKQPFELAD